MIGDIIDFLRDYDGEPIKIMEVCGTHTSVIVKNGIRGLISEKIQLISGPGCPVCVTSSTYIDRLCELLANPETTIATFGDMMKVKGEKTSLFEAKALGADIKILYSPMELIELAKQNPQRNFIMAAVGFETTAPIYSLLIETILEEKIANIRFLTSLKRMIPAIEYICKNENEIDGFIAPGNVSAIIGSDAYNDLSVKYKKPFVVTGFSVNEIILSIYILVKMKEKNINRVENIYKNVAKQNGNKNALNMLDKYFEIKDCYWRSIGIIENSGFFIKEKYKHLCADNFSEAADEKSAHFCSCGDIILGKIQPTQCKLFGKTCTPENPIGPCMVSSEGSCAIFYGG